jgi:hypothetical protein
VQGNNSTGAGGAVNAAADRITVARSTFIGNSAVNSGGALDVGRAGTTFALVENNTFFDNLGGEGGAMAVRGPDVEIAYNTIVGNNSGITIYTSSSSARLRGNILADNINVLTLEQENCETGPGAFESGGYNLLDSDAIDCPGLGHATDVFGVGPMLVAAPALDGGATPTMRPMAGSPAIDVADDPLCPDTDQRGEARPQGARCDAGAVERVVD